jgi:hypothetical protein
MIVRLLGLLGAGAFAFAAYLQHNDPDWPKWVAIYGAASAVCLLIALRRLIKLARLAATLIAVVALVWAGVLAAEVLRVRAFTGNEVERETGGLLIVAIFLSVVVFFSRKHTKHKAATSET